jgi:ABC-type uncharacterized transport system permease subunit
VDQSPQWRWLIVAAAILTAFLGAVSMTMERLHGWSFLVFCFVASLLGAVGYRWARERLLVVVLTAAVVLAGRLIANRHKPNEEFADVLAGIGVLVALAVFGLYRLMSHLLDSLHTGASRH